MFQLLKFQNKIQEPFQPTLVNFTFDLKLRSPTYKTSSLNLTP